MSKTKFQQLSNKALASLALECGLIAPPATKTTKTKTTKTKKKEVAQEAEPVPESPRASKTTTSDVSVASVDAWNTRDISEFSTSPGATQEDIPWDLRNDSLLEVAYNFVSRELLGEHVPEKPHVILLERQRHRSQGSPSVLEWVFRVNMFESILAGTVYTYKQRSIDQNAGSRDKSHHSTDLFRVDPRMVADYYIRGKRAKGKKFDIKAEKIGVVGQWLEAESHDMPEFEEMVKKAAAEKPEPKKKKTSKKKKTEEDEKSREEGDKGKPREAEIAPAPPVERKFIPRDLKNIPGFSPLTPQLQSLASHLEVMSSILAKKRFNSVKSKKADDVADSLLQALAWYNWQYNREHLRELLENEDDERWLEVNAWVKDNVE